MRGNIIKKGLMSFVFEKSPRINLGCKLVPVLYREYENSLLRLWFFVENRERIGVRLEELKQLASVFSRTRFFFTA